MPIILAPDERHHVSVTIDKLSKIRVYLQPLTEKYKLAAKAARDIEHALTSLALLSYSPAEPPIVPRPLFQDGNDNS